MHTPTCNSVTVLLLIVCKVLCDGMVPVMGWCLFCVIPPSILAWMQPVEEDLEEEEEFMTVDTYSNYKPAKCE